MAGEGKGEELLSRGTAKSALSPGVEPPRIPSPPEGRGWG
jgi:hypothetical protein